jgi:DnaJ-class molecular chaperone
VARDFYEVLGLDRNATEKDIRSAYRRLARKHHPDVNPNDRASETIFKEINAAHDVLADPEKRRKYDRYGDQWEHADEIERMQRSRGTRGARGSNIRFTTTDFGEGFDFASVLGGMFNGGGERSDGGRFRTGMHRAPANLDQAIEVTLEEAFNGATRMLMVEGDLGENRRLEVKIPPGVDTGSRVRITGEGRAGFGGQRGDLYLVVSVKPNPRFERKGDDLYTDVEVPLTAPILGGEAEVQGMNRKVALKLPPGTQNGQRFRLTGLGMPKLGQPDKRGDLFARVKVVLPKEPTEAQTKLFEQLKEAGV